MMISFILFEGISDRQANDIKRAFPGRQPIGLNDFVLFCFVLFCRRIIRKEEKIKKN